MREILFRGKTFDGEWEEGSLHIEYGETTADGKRNFDYRILGMRGECRYVDPETIGQFTRLTVNGKKIFEGDIINIHDYTNFDMTGVVEWNDCGFELHDRINDAFEVLWYPPTTITVLGNVHDNPELLEVTG